MLRDTLRIAIDRIIGRSQIAARHRRGVGPL
jgi:hypothetical protein